MVLRLVGSLGQGDGVWSFVCVILGIMGVVEI